MSQIVQISFMMMFFTSPVTLVGNQIYFCSWLMFNVKCVVYYHPWSSLHLSHQHGQTLAALLSGLQREKLGHQRMAVISELHSQQWYSLFLCVFDWQGSRGKKMFSWRMHPCTTSTVLSLRSHVFSSALISVTLRLSPSRGDIMPQITSPCSLFSVLCSFTANSHSPLCPRKLWACSVSGVKLVN